MVDQKTKIDRIHDNLARFFKTRANPNWKAIVEALGQSDETLTTLIEEVRKQFFVKTASRPYLDRLGANVKVSRPNSVGMDDPTFRRYIPVLAYQPKQVKLILDQLLDIFFFKESTSAFTQSQNFEPYDLKDGWELEYVVDGITSERIIFGASDFADIDNATADEVASAINRSAKNSFAVVFDDRVQKRKFIRIFSNTVGSKGSIQVVGGRADINLRFVGFNNDAGSGSTTQWTITKVGGTMTFQHTGGVAPNLQNIEVGDIAIIDVPGNEGSFTIESIDIANSSFSFTNAFGTAGTHDHALFPDSYVSFITPEQLVVYTRDSRAVVWEVSPGEIIVEMPASPPVVKRELKGSAHINGLINSVVNRVDDTTLELDDATDWPLNGGQFAIQQLHEIQTRYLTSSEDTTDSHIFNCRYDKQATYTYTSKNGNQLEGITPDLPPLSDIFEVTPATLSRDNSQVVTVTTSVDHEFEVGQQIYSQNIESALPTTGVRVDVSIADTATDVATAIAEKLDSYTDFSAISVGATVTVTNAANGATTNTSDVNTGMSITTSQEGSGTQPEITSISALAGTTFDVSGNCLYFTINSANDTTQYHVWLNPVDGTNSPINPGLDDPPNGTFVITEVPDSTTFKFISFGESGNGLNGIIRGERIGMSNVGSLAYLTSARLDTGILGPNIWDTNAAFVLSSLTSNIQQEIKAGTTARTIEIDAVNNIPNEEGFAIFGFGTEDQEGPVRYLFKPTDSSMQLDPAYIFENNHDVGSSVTVIRRRGAHAISTTGQEIAPYITDPGAAREVLQDLLRQVKSVGIFIEFLIRFPQQLYATLDVYRSGDTSLHPISQEDTVE